MGRTFQKLSHLKGEGGIPKILLQRGDNSEKGGVATFLKFNLHLLCVCVCGGGGGRGVKFVLLHFNSSVF